MSGSHHSQPPQPATGAAGVDGGSYPPVHLHHPQPVGQSPQDPPPSYHAAMQLPAATTSAPGAMQYMQPAENPAFPKQSPGHLPPQYDGGYRPPLPGGHYPHPNFHLHGHPALPQPPQVIPPQAMPHSQPVIVTVTNGTLVAGANCPYCRAGVIRSDTDFCCLLCLIVLAIFTFPFGLLFLCCIPCTIQNRCSQCNRIA